MKLNEILTEANRQSIILIDFQPTYAGATGYDEALQNACEQINRSPNVKVTAFFNGADVGAEETPDEVKWHYVEEGYLEEERLNNFILVEKTYAFLRNWMDNGVENSTIIKVLRYMVNNRINDSREIENLQEILGNEWGDVMEDDMIYLPDISLRELKSLSGSLIGGGGKHECLAEMQILMNAFNIKYKLVNNWIYG